jgi:hypothetical protein
MKYFLLIYTLLVPYFLFSQNSQNPFILFDFETESVTGIKPGDSQINWIKLNGGSVLNVKTLTVNNWPGVGFEPQTDFWNFNGYRKISADVTNKGTEGIEIYLRVDHPVNESGKTNSHQKVYVAPGQTTVLSVEIAPTIWITSETLSFKGMARYPSKANFDASQISRLYIFLNQPQKSYQFLIDNVRVEEKTGWLKTENFFPFADKYGQFKHDDWPEKIKTDQDLLWNKIEENKFFEQNSAPENRTVYGGWANGPRLDSTGFFRTEKYNGKWWIVDPTGRLFWSHGITGFTTGSETGITSREEYFEELFPNQGIYSSFYRKVWWVTGGFYLNKYPFDAYNVFGANLYRKYGNNWEQEFANLSHQRLKSWGMNTIANWSDVSTYGKRKTSYVVPVHFSCENLKPVSGSWAGFKDVFHPSFRQKFRESLADQSFSFNDSWCLGFFVDNELNWGNDGVSLALATLQCGSSQAAKQQFISDLKTKYSSIGELNKQWGASFESWEKFQQNTNLPVIEKARVDLESFYRKFAKTYFKTIDEEINAVAPNMMYLGSRFKKHDMNDAVLLKAAEHCDVVGINWYSETTDNLNFPNGFQKPVIIGEFHFGTRDRGNFNSGLQMAVDQIQRASMYKKYVESALNNPFIVGTHWFQLVDQPLTARFDGENSQLGFLSITDSPYYKIIQSAREIGDTMYVLRYGDFVSSVNDLQNSKMKELCIYPNPADDELIIQGLPGKCRIGIYNMSGQLVESCYSVNKVNISELKEGVYIFKVEGFKPEKLLIKRRLE